MMFFRQSLERGFRKVPQAFILIALLGNHDLGEETDQLLQASNADAIETTLEGVRECLVTHVIRVSDTRPTEETSAAALTLAQSRAKTPSVRPVPINL